MLTALFSNALLNLRESETEGNWFSVTLTSFVVFLKSMTQNEEISLMCTVTNWFTNFSSVFIRPKIEEASLLMT